MCQRMLEPGVPDQFTMQLCQRLLATPSFPSLGFLTTDLDDVCVCNPWNHRGPFGFAQLAFSLSSFTTAGGMAAVSLAMPTKLRDSAGRECGRTFLYLQRELYSSYRLMQR